MDTDLYLFNLINGFAKKGDLLDYFGIFMARYLGYVMVFILVLVSWALQDIRVFLFPFLAGLFARFIANEAIYFFYKRKRPMEVINVKQLVKKPSHPSFPSGHTSFLFAISLTLAFFILPLGIIFCVLAFLVGFFRVFAGVHWPLDIFGGIATGTVSVLLIYFCIMPWISYSL